MLRLLRSLPVALLLAAAPVAAQAATARTAAADSALVRYAGVVLIEKLAPALSEAAHDTTSQWWTMEFPASSVPGMWEELRNFLTGALHARDSLPRDRGRGFLVVRSVTMHASAMSFEVMVGGAQLCEGSWRGNDRTYLVRSEFSGRTWMWPTVTSGPHSYSPSCW